MGFVQSIAERCKLSRSWFHIIPNDQEIDREKEGAHYIVEGKLESLSRMVMEGREKESVQ